MITDFETSTPPDHSPYVVVGAGAVGLLFATYLSRQGKEVIVLETGGRSYSAASQALNTSVISGRSHEGVTSGRARVLGGTSTLWGGQLIAFDKIDLEPRPWLGLAGWPIDRDELSPYYSKVARLLGLDSTSSDDEAVWQEIKLKSPDLDPDFSVILTRWLKEPNLARYFSEDLENSRTLNVLLHAQCTGFRFNEDGSALTAVSIASPGGRIAEIKADNVILATGTIEASRLMLATAREAAPWKDNPWVGRCFQDHLDARSAKVHIKDKRAFHDKFDNIVVRGFKYQPKIRSKGSFQKANATTNIAASFVADSDISEHIAKLKIAIRSIMRGAKPDNLGDLFKSIKGASSVWLPLVLRYLRDNRVMQVADRGLYLVTHCEQIPIAASRISLSETEHDAFGMPLVDLDWQVDGREVEGVRHFVQELGTILEAQGLATLEIDPRLERGGGDFLEVCQDTNHQCGGLRMAASSNDGVTDANSKVHGCDNLYVAGAAVFPSSSFANPTFTAMALAVRLAEHLHAKSSA